MTEQPRVFISYARQDGERFATALRQRLERDEPEVTLWQDRARMQGGVGWWKQITDALDVVQFLVLVMTPAAMQSPMARKEWRYARQQGVCVYPVKGVPDSALAYDDLPHWMRKAHFFDLEREWETFVNYLKSPSRATRVPFMAPDLPEGFVERPDVLARLLEGLIGSERANPVAGVTALRGAGGLGKTTLAAAVCHHDDVITAFDDGILWVTLGQKPNVQQGLTKLYAALTGERPGFVDEEDAAVHLAETLEEKGCLVVIDDVWEAAHLRPFLRAGANCSRLITTRQFDIAAEAKRVEVDEMTLAEAVQMLTFRLPHLPLDLVPFRALADRLGRWPLLLELAGATLMHRIGRGDTPDGAVSYLNTKLDRQGVVAFDNRNATERHQAIAKTLEVSLDLLDQPDRQHVTQLAIFHEDTDVPLEMVGALWTLDDFDTEELAQRLDGFSLVKFSLQAGTIRLHDVVRDYLVSQLIDGRGLHSRLVDTLGDPRHLSSSYAWRWLPYHFVEAHREGELRALLLDFEWLQAKLRAIDATSLLSDYDFFPHDDALRLLQGAIRLSAHVLGADKTQLAAQLLGRLPPDGPLAIRELREQALRWRGAPWLRPLRPLLTAPGESLVCTLAGHGGRVTAVAVTPDGARAISASDEGLLKVWNLEQGTEERTLAGHTDWVRAVVVTADCWHAISASDDHTIRVWNIETGKQELLIDTQYEWLRAVAVTPDGRQIISASDGPTLTVWDRGGGERGVLRGHSAKVNAMAVTADGRRGVSASDDRTVRVWDLDSLREVRTLRGHTAKVVALGLTPDNRFAISAGADDLMCLWDLAPDGGSDGPWIISARAYWVRDLKMLPDARRIITASEDHKLTIWDVQTGKPERTLVGHTDWVNAVALLPDGRAVSASDDHTLKVWDLQSTASKQTIEAPRLGGTSLEGMPESTAGPALAASGSDQSACRSSRRQTRRLNVR
jgi:WD40 repeat protein